MLQQVLDIAPAWAGSHLDDGDAVLIAGETADEKSSADCAGAARQHSGTAGGVALCQVAVTLTVATSRGHALIGRALYLSEGCAAAEEHRELAGVPEEVLFATKPQLAAGAGTVRAARGAPPIQPPGGGEDLAPAVSKPRTGRDAAVGVRPHPVRRAWFLTWRTSAPVRAQGCAAAQSCA